MPLEVLVGRRDHRLWVFLDGKAGFPAGPSPPPAQWSTRVSLLRGPWAAAMRAAHQVRHRQATAPGCSRVAGRSAGLDRFLFRSALPPPSVSGMTNGRKRQSMLAFDRLSTIHWDRSRRLNRFSRHRRSEREARPYWPRLRKRSQRDFLAGLPPSRSRNVFEAPGRFSGWAAHLADHLGAARVGDVRTDLPAALASCGFAERDRGRRGSRSLVKFVIVIDWRMSAISSSRRG